MRYKIIQLTTILNYHYCHFDVNYLSKEQDGLHELRLEDLRLEQFQRATIYLKEASARLAVSDCGGCFL
jgi:hypothetical protein